MNRKSVFLVAVAVTTVHLIFFDDSLSIFTPIGASVLVLLAIKESYLWFKDQKIGKRYLPFLPMILWNVYFFLGMAVFFPYDTYVRIQRINRISSFDFNMATIAIVIFTLCLWFIFRASWKWKSRLLRSIRGIIPDLKKDVVTVRITVWINLTVCFFVALLLRKYTVLYIEVVLALTYSPVLFLGLHLWFYVKKLEKGKYIVVSVLLSVAASSTGLSIHEMLFPIIFWFFAKIMRDKKITVLIALLPLAIYIFMNPLKIEFRRYMQSGASRDEAILDTFVNSWVYVMSENRGYRAMDSESNYSRFNELILVADCIKRVPDTIEYEGGKPWRVILYTLIPRVLWPEKPDLREIYTTYYAGKFGYMDPAHHKYSAANLPAVADGFWNFGWVGIIVVAIVLGFIFKFMQRLTSDEKASLTAIGWYLISINRPNNAFGIIIGGLPQKLIGAILAIIIAKFTQMVIEAIIRKRR